MSYFESGTPTTEATPATETTQTTPEDFVAEVVKQKGEQWSDPQVLAKGYANAQAMIAELEAKVAAASKNDYAKELLATLGNKQVPANEVTETVSTGEEKTTLTPESIESLIETTLTAREQTKTKAQNLADANTQLTTLFGTEAAAKVDSRAKELGLSKERLEEIAGESPSAFLALLGEAPRKETNTLTTTTRNTTELSEQDTGERNSAYYTKLRRENRKLFMAPETQAQMFKDAQRLGADYYK